MVLQKDGKSHKKGGERKTDCFCIMHNSHFNSFIVRDLFDDTAETTIEITLTK